jgi:hypothetical protein
MAGGHGGAPDFRELQSCLAATHSLSDAVGPLCEAVAGGPARYRPQCGAASALPLSSSFLRRMLIISTATENAIAKYR